MPPQDDYENPLPGKTYISPRLDAFGQQNRKISIASKLIESADTYAFGTIKAEIVIRRREGGKSHITAKFFEDDRKLFVLTVQSYTIATINHIVLHSRLLAMKSRLFFSS